MSRQPNASFIGRENITDNTQASGIYTLSDVAQKVALNEFPPARYTPSRSLRFDNGRGTYLQRTFVNPTNARKWTWSGWVKKTRNGVQSPFMSRYVDGNNFYTMGFDSNDKLYFYDIYNFGSYDDYGNIGTNVYRDVNAWYHVVFSYDTTLSNSKNRFRMFVNGVQDPTLDYYGDLSQNYDSYYINAAGVHRLGYNTDSGAAFNGYMTEVNYIDGEGLLPTAFGEYDPRTNEWRPKKYTGTYGNNGFYVNFSDNASTYSLGRDFSGYSNLLSYTDQLDNAYWTKTRASITANTIANPIDGTVNADKLIETATTGTHFIENASAVTKLASGTYTFSVYAKAAERSTISLQLSESGGGYMGSVFDLSAGTAYVYTGIAMTPVNADWQTITAVGNGWYRCSVSVNTTSATNITARICLDGYEASYAGVAGNGVHLYGMQLNAGSTPAAYTSITASPRSNDWAPVNFSLTAGANYDSFTDVPVVGPQATNDTGGVVRGNYATWNPLDRTAATYSNGNLTVVSTSSAAPYNMQTTLQLPTTGKWYCEVTATIGSNNPAIGIGNNSPDQFACYRRNGTYITSGISGIVSSGTPATYVSNDIIGIAYDADAGKLDFYKNNVLQTGGFTGIPATGYFIIVRADSASGDGGILNAGQKPFVYTPPVGYKSLCTSNLPEPVIKRPSEHFDIKLWSGNTSNTTIGNNVRTTDNYQISRSLRFSRADSSFLSRTATTPTDGRKATMSFWIKKSDISVDTNTSYRSIFYCGTPNSDGLRVGFARYGGYDNHEFHIAQDFGSSSAYFGLRTTQFFRDTSAWYHFVIRYDSTDALPDNRQRIYVNGVEIRSFISRTNAPLNHIPRWQINGTTLKIGKGRDDDNEHIDMYLTEFNFIDGQALDPSSFGQFDTDGSWQPKRYTGTYGNNGYFLNFSDNSNTTATTLGKDQAGSNNFTPSGFSVTAGSGNDSLVDVPTNWGGDTTDNGGEVRGNYAVLDATFKGSTYIPTISNGNLTAQGENNTQNPAIGTLTVTSGKWYYEVYIDNQAYSPNIGWIEKGNLGTGDNYRSLNNAIAANTYSGTGYVTVTSSNGSTGTQLSQISSASYAWTTGNTVMVALDADAKKVWFGKNGTWFTNNGVGNPGTGEFPTATYPWNLPMTALFDGTNNGGNKDKLTYNFGQRPFEYAAPTGFRSLNTKNLNEQYPFVTGPDLVWIKTRNTGSNWVVADTVRGPGREIFPSLTNAEQTGYPNNFVTNFTSNGFQLGLSNTGTGDVNISGNTYVGWCWNAGSRTVNNQDGAISSNVRVNQAAGFSIVSYGGIGSDTNVGHGLGKTPDFIIWKALDDAYNWDIYHKVLGHNATLIFTASGTRNVLHEAPTHLTIPVKHTYSGGSAAGKRMIAYCWYEVPGYSKFGTYTANGVTDGPFIYTGFRPRFILGKDSSNPAGANNWWIFDTARDTFNDTVSNLLRPNLTDGELSNANRVEILSNGFKVRASGALPNDTSGAVYVYAAFAEMPFKYALAR